MKKRRLLAALAAAAMSVTMLAGCGGDKPAASGSGSAAKSGGGDGGLNMTMIIASRDEFMSTLEASCKDAAKDMGINMTTQDAQFDTSKMLQYIETARNNGEDAVIINIVDPETAQQCIDAAGDMKVVFVNRSLDESVYSQFDENVCGVWSDEDTSGYYQGEYLAKYFKDQGKTDVKYIMMCGTLGQVYTTKRTEGAIKALKDNGINPIPATADLVGEYDRATAMDQISPLVATLDYDCVICNNDSMAEGAITALNTIGYNQDGGDKTIPVFGVDATDAAKSLISKGQMAGSIKQDADGMAQCITDIISNVAAGKDMMDGIADKYTVDDSVNKIRIPYQIYLGE